MNVHEIVYGAQLKDPVEQSSWLETSQGEIMLSKKAKDH
jgi:hypothetical protein